MTPDALRQVIQEKAAYYRDRVVAIRRHLHQHPELSFEERKTSAYLAGILSSEGIAVRSGWAGYGLVANIPGNGSTWMALRADMDALPIQEASEVSYKSHIEGVMHACGHDVHSACLLGAALILHSLRDVLPVSVRCIFQPGEEKLPGGASMMIAEGVLDQPGLTGIVGQHVFPELETGKVGIRSGLYMASSDEIYITIKGKGGHAAMPHECSDVILTASHIIVALQQVSSRFAPPAVPTVFSIGKCQSAGGATNVLPSAIHLEGTFRTMDEEWRARAHRHIETIVRDICHSAGCEADVRIFRGYPSLVNDPALTASVRHSLVSYLGEDNVMDLPIRMTSEDFAFYSHHVPACFYRLGTGNALKGITAPVHSPYFDVDENSIETGMGLMAWIACQPAGEVR